MWSRRGVILETMINDANFNQIRIFVTICYLSEQKKSDSYR